MFLCVSHLAKRELYNIIEYLSLPQTGSRFRNQRADEKTLQELRPVLVIKKDVPLLDLRTIICCSSTGMSIHANLGIRQRYRREGISRQRLPAATNVPAACRCGAGYGKSASGASHHHLPIANVPRPPDTSLTSDPNNSILTLINWLQL